MKKITGLENWDAFERRLNELYDERRQLKGDPNSSYVSDLLFRGQPNADWRLTTTLERYAVSKCTLLRADTYYQCIHAAKPQIETYTGRHWEIDDPLKYRGRLKESPLIHKWFEGPIYEYMVFLRHYGFPSPFLDWSRSPYIAAFFAFRDAVPEDGRVAVYAFVEYAGKGKTGQVGSPKISGLGPYVASHKRHFIQQSEYTVCTQGRDGDISFSSHQTAFENSRVGQDILWKMTLPVDQRLEILRILDLHNINSLSLFDSDEGLMETVALRELMLRE